MYFSISTSSLCVYIFLFSSFGGTLEHNEHIFFPLYGRITCNVQCDTNL